MSYKNSGIKVLKSLKKEPQYKESLINLINKYRGISYKQSQLYLEWIESNEYASIKKIGLNKIGNTFQYDYILQLKSKGFDYLDKLESENQDLNKENLSEIIQSNKHPHQPNINPSQKEEKESIWNKPPNRVLQMTGLLVATISIIIMILISKGII